MSHCDLIKDIGFKKMLNNIEQLNMSNDKKTTLRELILKDMSEIVCQLNEILYKRQLKYAKVHKINTSKVSIWSQITGKLHKITIDHDRIIEQTNKKYRYQDDPNVKLK